MGATANSRFWGAKGRLKWAALAVAVMLWAHTVAAADPAVFRAHAGADFNGALARHQKEPANAEAAWRFGRACFDYAEFATNDAERATLAVEGIAAMRDLIAREPKLAAGHYYLAMNLGELARTKMLGALKIVNEMEREFKLAQGCDERWDFAGPARNLGELYFQAPGWPTSIGSRHKARVSLERAVALAPEYPENHLNLLEAYLKWGDNSGVERELKAVDEMWPVARKSFTGRKWESDWADWVQRREKLAAEATQWLSSRTSRSAP